jgi:hypothetical protein
MVNELISEIGSPIKKPHHSQVRMKLMMVMAGKWNLQLTVASTAS